ncbi:MAG TPA: hypothetical protein VKC54_00505 [Patescibacteria group bacterium]|nr:hypothetical protein [Patescibacteria group bacterium]
MMKFTKSEVKGLALIFLVLIAISVPNFVVSLKRARDQVRKDDMGALVHALDSYFSDFGIFPPASPDGRIMACKKPGDIISKDKQGHLVVNFIPCDWGKDGILDITQDNGKVYMRLLPRDPNFKNGPSYRYISDGVRFQIYVSLEDTTDIEYDSKIIARNLVCGNVVCNAGRGFADTPTDISLEEYEKGLMEKHK